MTEEMRMESDSIGTMEVPKEAYYGVQALRAKQNFPITGQSLHPVFIRNLAKVKKAAAQSNRNALALPADKAELTGTPIRQELLSGDKEAGRRFCDFTEDKPVLLIIGGSLGAASVNEHVRKILPELLKDFQVIHLCGKGKMDESLQGTKGYVQYEYIKQELPDLFALSDIVISRAGANAICELSALHKPNLLIPLSANASRGDQILNARSFEKQGYSMVLEEEEITDEKLLDTIHKLYADRETFEQNMTNSQHMDSIQHIVSLIQKYSSR